MGGSLVPGNFGRAAELGFIAEQRGDIGWWDTCIASALLDLTRVDGVVTVLCGLATRLRDGADPAWVVGDAKPRAAIDEAVSWLAAGILAHEVEGWLQAGCWDPAVAARLTAVGLRPPRLVLDGHPRHWVTVAGGQRVPIALACCDHGWTPSQAVAVVTASHRPYASPHPQPNKTQGEP